MDGKTYCEPCVWKASREAKEAGRTADYVALQDHSICARCGAYSGDNADHPIVGKLPLCGACSAQVVDWPYPSWLKISLAALLLLLVIGLLHGRKYFHAGRALYQGERLVEQGQYAKAVPLLQETISIAPGSDKAVILTAKAALLSGQFDVAQKALQGHDGGHFKDTGEDFREVEQIWNRATRALKEATQAAKLEGQEGKAAEAARMMHEAASTYPEAIGLTTLAEAYDEGAAYERRDYDEFVAIAQKQYNKYPGTQTAAALASALACKYAASGDTAYRTQAEQMLDTAIKGAPSDPAQAKDFQEYVARTRYRIDSRQIISKQEYDRRFGKLQQQAAKAD
jgi:tetratricopeptide (TPR) repeat protein